VKASRSGFIDKDQSVGCASPSYNRFKAHALKVSAANRAWGRNYSREFGEWIRQHGFDKMPAATRSVAVELHEHADAITTWRDTLPERQRKRLVYPLSVTRRWRALISAQR
jgi:hypothetical protein